MAPLPSTSVGLVQIKTGTAHVTDDGQQVQKTYISATADRVPKLALISALGQEIKA